MLYHLTPKSSNKKTGPIPVSTSSFDTCPDACVFKANGCYAGYGPLNIHWQHVTNGKRGMSFEDFTTAISNLSDGQLWRHNQAGDLPGVNNKIDAAALRKLTKANKGKRGFTYTHKPLTDKNLKLIREANYDGFTINISTESLSDAEKVFGMGLPATVVVPASETRKSFLTSNGTQVSTCPAAIGDTSCDVCQLCARPNRKSIVAFPVHGTGAKKAEKNLGSNHPTRKRQ